MGRLILDLLLVIVGVALLVFHRPVARWQQSQWKEWQIWPITLLPTPQLSAYVIPLIAAGIVLVIFGVLSLAGIGDWK
jgi:uncharacterized membrane protein YidH (DUF202 family)